jgi:acyl-coenzyme A thioesterase PaaI-like protein
MPTDVAASPSRRLGVAWCDPAVAARAGQGRDGLGFLQRPVAGEVHPLPLSALLGIDPVAAEQGRVTMSMMPGPYLYRPVGSRRVWAEVVHAGRRRAGAEARLTDGTGHLGVPASTTCLLPDPPAGDDAPPAALDPTLATRTRIS